MILSLDTNVLVDVMRGTKPFVRHHMEAALGSGARLVASTIVVQELALGAFLSARPQYHIDLMDELLAGLQVEPWSREDAVVTAHLRATRERIGRRLGAYDTLIAGQALSRGWALVTADVGDFQGVDGLQLIDWSDPAGPIDVTGGKASLRRPPED